MKHNLIKSNTIVFIACLLVGCSGRGNTNPDGIVTEFQGNLSLVANGEDFVRKGFKTKDGWQINFEKVEVNIGEVIAYQRTNDLSLEDQSQIEPEMPIKLLQEPKTINLAESKDDAKPILVKKSKVSEGFYNALSWKMLPRTDRTFLDSHTILLKGIGTKADRKLNFILGFNQPVTYLCGEFVGNERKGMIKPGGNTEVEMTFHFDHIFGDGTVATKDEINQNALGFDPLANLATVDDLKLSQQDLKKGLSSEAYQKLEKAIAGLGHVGEGHCKFMGNE